MKMNGFVLNFKPSRLSLGGGEGHDDFVLIRRSKYNLYGPEGGGPGGGGPAGAGLAGRGAGGPEDSGLAGVGAG